MNRSVSTEHQLLRLLVVAIAASCSHSAVSQRNRPPSIKPPDSCALSLSSMANIRGLQAYIRLRYVIEALNSAQESVTDLGTSLKEFNATTDPTNALATLLIGTDQAKDALHCASAVMSQYPATDKEDRTIKVILVSAFDHEADVIAGLTAHMKQQFIRPAKDQTNTTKLHDAERISTMTAAQNKAATDILETVTYALLRSVDLSDTTAKTAEYLSLSCDEYADLSKTNAPLARADKSAYSQPATFIQKVLDEHKCRPGL